MNNLPVQGLLEILQQVPDPRGREGQRHPLPAMLAAVVCAMFCGFHGLRPTVRWLALHGVDMWHLLGFRRKPPVRQTFANVLARLDPEFLERVLLEFVEQLDLPEAAPPPAEEKSPAPAGDHRHPEVEVWDGKYLRGTRGGEQRAEQLLVRMELALGRILSSRAVPRDTMESPVALELVRNLVLKGKLVVVDAAFCQRDFCQAVIVQEGDYLVTVKGNQPQLLRDVEQAFVIPRSFSPLRRASGGRAATDRRHCGEEPRPHRTPHADDDHHSDR